MMYVSFAYVVIFLFVFDVWPLKAGCATPIAPHLVPPIGHPIRPLGREIAISSLFLRVWGPG